MIKWIPNHAESTIPCQFFTLYFKLCVNPTVVTPELPRFGFMQILFHISNSFSDS